MTPRSVKRPVVVPASQIESAALKKLKTIGTGRRMDGDPFTSQAAAAVDLKQPLHSSAAGPVPSDSPKKATATAMAVSRPTAAQRVSKVYISTSN